MKPVIFHADAEAELCAAVAYYEQQRPGLGLDLQSEVARVNPRAVHSGKSLQCLPVAWLRSAIPGLIQHSI